MEKKSIYSMVIPKVSESPTQEQLAEVANVGKETYRMGVKILSYLDKG